MKKQRSYVEQGLQFTQTFGRLYNKFFFLKQESLIEASEQIMLGL